MRGETEAYEKLLKASMKKEKDSEWNLGLIAGQGGSPDHLNLITLHSAKGREFDVVILPGMDNGILPSWNATEDNPIARKEDRRLFYVGLTRARFEVHMTYSGFNVNRYGRRFENGPSDFLIEVRERMDQS